MSNYAVQVNNLGKMYHIGGLQQNGQTLRETINKMAMAPFRRARNLISGQAYGAAGLNEEMWALKDISFDVKHGEVIGIIGHNGAGKSTLLKVLSRITEPTTGYADIYGRVGALLEVGTGFHSELTGRENVYLNGAILGMSRQVIDRKFDEIVDFSGVEKFIDTPVKHYSSGMGLRLGFAVAAHLEPEILIVDEVLAVGDAEFQKKCIGKMSDVAGEGRTVIFVSHNMAAVDNLCDRGILLSHGNIIYQGTQTSTISYYLADLESSSQKTNLANILDHQGSGSVRIKNIRIKDSNGQPISVIPSGDDISINLDFESPEYKDVQNVRVGIRIYSERNTLIFTQNTRVMVSDFRTIPQSGVFVCNILQIPLPAGIYYITYTVKANDRIADKVERARSFTVIEGDYFGTGQTFTARYGTCLVKGSWDMIKEE